MTGIDAEMVVYEPRAVVGHLPDPPAPAPPARALTDRPADDALAAIPAAVHVPLLCGREPKPRRQGALPVPRRRAGADAQPARLRRRLACFGCDPLPGAGRDHLGGDIYVFAALLWGYPLPVRGRELVEMRRRLAQALAARRAA